MCLRRFCVVDKLMLTTPAHMRRIDRAEGAVIQRAACREFRTIILIIDRRFCFGSRFVFADQKRCRRRIGISSERLKAQIVRPVHLCGRFCLRSAEQGLLRIPYVKFRCCGVIGHRNGAVLLGFQERQTCGQHRISFQFG